MRSRDPAFDVAPLRGRIVHATRSLLITAMVSFILGILLLLGGFLCLDESCGQFAWFRVHGLVLMLGTVLPALAALHAWTLDKLAGAPMPEAKSALAAKLWLVGVVVITLGMTIGPSVMLQVFGLVGFAIVTAGATFWSIQVMKHAPKKGLTDFARDPLTKGDDACLKHVHFAHRFLPIGMILLLAAAIAAEMSGAAFVQGLRLASIHIIVVGYGMLSMYGISHFWIPRLSGIPAIAAGAIKGELHTSLLGIVGITAGFLVGVNTGVGRGLLVGLGPMVFLGFFVWMGVLGANIMKNKSPTNSVRPEFVYIPWVFSSVFWAVTAVLMGLFLNGLPESMSHLFPALRFTHLHVGLLGGAIQLLLGLGTRQIPLAVGQKPPRFGSSMKGSFYLFNIGLAMAIYGRFDGIGDVWVTGGLLVVIVSLLLYLKVMLPFFAPRPTLT